MKTEAPNLGGRDPHGVGRGAVREWDEWHQQVEGVDNDNECVCVGWGGGVAKIRCRPVE